MQPDNDLLSQDNDELFKNQDEQYKEYHERQLSDNGTHVVNHNLGKNLHWLHGLEEYMEFTEHKHLEKYKNLKRAIMYGNIWYIKELIADEIRRGEIDLTDEFLNIILAHYTGYEHINHRKVLQYVSHCIDDEYIRKISSWSIKWQRLANLNEHFSRGQMKSKCWMVKELKEVFPDKYLGIIAHYGGWYATIAQSLFNNFQIAKYYNLELDHRCIEIADDFNYQQNYNKWQFKSVHQNCGDILYDENNSFNVQVANRNNTDITINIKPSIIINTSCEHMNEDWFHNLPDGMLVCLQTNDYFSNKDHINCVGGINEAKAKYPMKEVLYEGTLDTHLYNRFMLIGEK